MFCIILAVSSIENNVFNSRKCPHFIVCTVYSNQARKCLTKPCKTILKYDLNFKNGRLTILKSGKQGYAREYAAQIT